MEEIKMADPENKIIQLRNQLAEKEYEYQHFVKLSRERAVLLTERDIEISDLKNKLNSVTYDLWEANKRIEILEDLTDKTNVILYRAIAWVWFLYWIFDILTDKWF